MNLSKTLSDARKSRNALIGKQYEKLLQKQAKLQELARRATFVSDVFEEDEAIQKGLKKLGLTFKDIKVLTFGKKMLEDDSMDDNAMIDATLIPTSGKFKFIAFKGYDARGAGKNHKQLENKRAKIEETLSSDEFSASVNLYSLEDNATSYSASSRNSENRVMITWRPKF